MSTHPKIVQGTRPAPSSPERSMLTEETHITEITLQPDGRIFVFGLSRQVLAILREFSPHDSPIRRLVHIDSAGEP